MSDEQPGAQELAEAEALARALEGQTEGPEPPRDALEVAALLRLVQPSAALEPVRADSVLARVLEGASMDAAVGPAAASRPVALDADERSGARSAVSSQPRAGASAARPAVEVSEAGRGARAPARRARWLWGGLGAASSLAAAALVLLMLRRTAPEQAALGAVPAAPPAASEAPAPARVADDVPASAQLGAAEPAALQGAMARAVRRSQLPERAAPAHSAKSPAAASAPLSAAEVGAAPEQEQAARSAPAEGDEAVARRAELRAAWSPTIVTATSAPGPRAELLQLQAALASAELARARQAQPARDDEASSALAAGVSDARPVAGLDPLIAAQARYRDQFLRSSRRAAPVARVPEAARQAPERALSEAMRTHAPIEVQLDLLFELASSALARGDTARARSYARRGTQLTQEPSPSLVSLWLVRALAERSAQLPAAALVSLERARALLDRLR